MRAVVSGLAVLVLLLAGCGEPAAVREARAIEAAMCACRDTACASRALDRVRAFDERFAGQSVSRRDERRVLEALGRARACYERAGAAVSP